MPLFIFGLYLAAVGLTGNAGGLLEALAGSGAFVPFAVSVGIGWYAWYHAPEPERKPVHILLIGLILVVLITQSARIIAGFKIAWNAINSLKGGSIQNANIVPGGALMPGGGTNDPFSLGGNMAGLPGLPTDLGLSGSGLSDYLLGTSVDPAGSLSGMSLPASLAGILTTGYGNLSPGQIAAESGGQQFNPDGSPLVSSAGAVGVAQLLPSTAQQVAASIGVPYSLSSLQNDPAYNLELGSAYMGQLINQFGGNKAVALAAYNLGPNSPAVQNFAQTGDINSLPPSVQAYVTQGLQ